MEHHVIFWKLHTRIDMPWTLDSLEFGAEKLEGHLRSEAISWFCYLHAVVSQWQLKGPVLVNSWSYGGRKKSCTSWKRWFIPFFLGFQPSQLMQDFFHPQYHQVWTFPSQLLKFQHFWVIHIQLLLLHQDHPRCKIHVACWEMQAYLPVQFCLWYLCM